jgi:DNA-binding IclR family transcriptional regulator
MDKTLLKGLQVLEFVINAGEPVRSTDVAAKLELVQSNAHRVLKSLEAAGYLRQDLRSKMFYPSLKLWELGSSVVGGMDVRQRAADHLQELSRRTQETVHLSVLDGRDVVYVEKIDSPQHISVYTRIGGRAPVHCSATGKAILAYLPETQVKSILTDLPRFTPSTRTEQADLMAELEQARARGYAQTRSEWRQGVCAVAAAIRDDRGLPIASIGLAGPETRMGGSKRMAELGALVSNTASRLSEYRLSRNII